MTSKLNGTMMMTVLPVSQGAAESFKWIVMLPVLDPWNMMLLLYE